MAQLHIFPKAGLVFTVCRPALDRWPEADTLINGHCGGWRHGLVSAFFADPRAMRAVLAAAPDTLEDIDILAVPI